jgi:glycosyltransferase involved in cell wall biosynthesis
MKILYLTLEDLSLHKGSVIHIKEIIAGLRKRGHRIGLIGRSSNRSEEADYFYNLQYGPLSFPKWFRSGWCSYPILCINLFLCLFRVLRRYDLIYAREFHTVVIAFVPRLVFHKKLVFEINGIANEEYRMKGDSIPNRVCAFLIEKAERFACAYSDRIVSVTPQIGSYLVQRYRADRAKIFSISNGVNTRKFFPIGNEQALNERRTRVGIGPKDKVITFVGNLAPWQGVELLIGAAPGVMSEIEGVKFLIIGDGKSREEYEREVGRLGLRSHFIFTGMVDYKEIPLYINLSDICVLPKRRLKSGYSPIKLYEYMACGKPVIATKMEGLGVIEEAGAGRLTDLEDRKGLEEAMKELLKDRAKRMEMGRKGLKMVRERFDWMLKVIEIEEVLRNLA